MESRLPSISVVTPTLNCALKLRECYKRLREQDYPDFLVELIVVDGGSVDETLRVAQEYDACIIEGAYRDNQEARRWLGVQKAKNELILYLDSDNYLPDRMWLKQMILPFSDSDIVASQPLRYAYEKKETLMNRYFALFGVNDPVAFYLKKADRLSYLFETWNSGGKLIQETKGYLKIEFSESDLPTVGSNGFLFRRSALSQLSLKPQEFFHIDNNVDLIRKGFNKYALVKNAIIHSTGETFLKNIIKRIQYMKVHYGRLNDLRRYKVFDESRVSDRINLFKFVFFTLTFLEPLFLSIRGYLKVRDRAWFVHPFVCFGFLFAYGYSFITNFLSQRFTKQRIGIY